MNDINEIRENLANTPCDVFAKLQLRDATLEYTLSAIRAIEDFIMVRFKNTSIVEVTEGSLVIVVASFSYPLDSIEYMVEEVLSISDVYKVDNSVIRALHPTMEKEWEQ